MESAKRIRVILTIVGLGVILLMALIETSGFMTTFGILMGFCLIFVGYILEGPFRRLFTENNEMEYGDGLGAFGN